MFNDGVDQNGCRTAPVFRAYSANAILNPIPRARKLALGYKYFAATRLVIAATRLVNRRYAAGESQLRC
jgi:hypothetical protein